MGMERVRQASSQWDHAGEDFADVAKNVAESVAPLPDDARQHPGGKIYFFDRHKLLGGVGQRDIARTEADRRNPCLVEKRRVRPRREAFDFHGQLLALERATQSGHDRTGDAPSARWRTRP
jgi:hypothetical protein